MVGWHEDEAQLSRRRRASTVRDAQGNWGRESNKRSGREPDKGNAGRGGAGGVEGKLRWTRVGRR